MSGDRRAGCTRHKGSLRVCENPPKGPETGANQSVSGNEYFRLTRILIFGKLGIVEITEIPFGLAPTSSPPLAGFVVSGSGFLPERLTVRANHSHTAQVSAKILRASSFVAQKRAE